MYFILRVVNRKYYHLYQMSMYDLPIDAEFCADFKNVYFCIPILRIFRVMVIERPKKARFGGKGAFFGLDMAKIRKIRKIGI